MRSFPQLASPVCRRRRPASGVGLGTDKLHGTWCPPGPASHPQRPNESGHGTWDAMPASWYPRCPRPEEPLVGHRVYRNRRPHRMSVAVAGCQPPFRSAVRVPGPPCQPRPMSIIGYRALQGPCASCGRISRDPLPWHGEAAGGRHCSKIKPFVIVSRAKSLCLRPFLFDVLLTVQMRTAD